MVWSAARRQTGSTELAEEVTQTVFATLAQKAKTIREGEAIGGWLLVTTRYTALNVIRSEARRRRHEREAAAMKREADSSELDPAWKSVAPLLDEGVAKLKREDRDAVVLRYFQGKSTADVAVALNVSPEAAQKRLSRAVDRLRTWLAARGVRTSADALGLMLASQAVGHAPEALAAALASSSAASSAVAGKGAIVIMAAVKTKVAVAVTSVVLLAGVTGTIAYQTIKSSGTKTRQVRVDATQTATPARAKLAPPVPVEQWMPKFRELYALKPGENVKFIPRPWIAERTGFYRQQLGESQYEAIPAGPDVMCIEDDGTTLKETRAMFGGPPTVQYGAEYVLGIEAWDLRGEDKLLNLPMRGDWVVRKDLTREQRTEHFLSIVSKASGSPKSLSYSEIPRLAVVIRGTYAPATQPIVPPRSGRNAVVFYRGTVDPKRANYAGGSLADRIASVCHVPVIDEAGVPNNKIEVHTAPNVYINKTIGEPQRLKQIDELLANLSAQTSLELTRETRTLPLWMLVPGEAATTQPVATGR
jgi:RNA polymerase sigma factor (sigma-70 family)